MAIPLLSLDDRKFTDLVDELRALIPRYSRRWTDYNVSDPGIMLMELFAWLTDALLYRINRVPEASRVRLLELLGALFQPAAPAVIALTVSDENLVTPYILPRGTQIHARPTPTSEEILFETIADVQLGPEAPVQTIRARQTAYCAQQQLGFGAGEAYQLFTLPQRYLALPPAPFPQRPNVWVDQELWAYRLTLNDSAPTDRHFTVKPWLNSLVFGNGQADAANTHGQIPQADAKITASYRFGTDRTEQVAQEVVGVSNGEAGQRFRLAKPLLALDLQAFDDLMPTVRVNGQPWEYRANYLAMGADALTYTFEPWRNVLRFGDGAHGCKPAAGALIEIDYHYTQGAAGNVPVGATFTFDRRATGRPHLRVEENFTQVSLGRNPTGPEDVDDQLYALLHEQWRAITGADVETVIRQNGGEIAHAYCLPGYALDPNAPAVSQPAQMGVILAPQPTAQTHVASTSVQEMLGLTLNGQRFVARDDEGIVHLCDAKSGEKLVTLGPKVRALACHPDGVAIAVASEDHHLWLWDGATGPKQKLYRHPAAINAIAFGSAQAHGQKVTYVATACADHLVRVWRMDDLDAPPMTFTHAAPVNAIAFSPDGQFLVSAGNDGRAVAWALQGGRKEAEFARANHNAALFAVAFSPDGSLLATAGLDRIVSLWLWSERQVSQRPAAGKPESEQGPFASLPHAATVLDIAFHPNHRQLVTACRDGTAQLWDIDSATRVSLFQHTGPVNAVAVDPDGEILATAGADHTVGLWDLPLLQKLATLEHNAAVNTVAFSAPKRLTTGCDDAGVRLWEIADVAKRQEVANIAKLYKSALFPAKLQTVTFSPDGRRLTAIAGDTYAALWDTATGAPIANLAQAAPVKQAIFSPDGQRLATVNADQQVRVWDAAQGNLLALLPAGAGNISIVDLVFCPDNQQLATVDDRHTVRLWALNHKPQLVWPHTLAVKQAAFVGDGGRLLTVDDAGVAQLWATKSGELLASTSQALTIAPLRANADDLWWAIINSQSMPLSLITFDRQGSWLAASVGSTVYVWNLTTAEVAKALTHEQPVTGIVFAASGKALATVTADHTVHLWHGPAWEELGALPHDTAVLSMAFAEEQQQWITVTADQTLSRWHWDPASKTFICIGSSRVVVDKMDLMRLSPDGRQLATVADGAKLYIHDVVDGAVADDTIVVSLPQAYAVEQLFFHPTAAQVVTVNRDGKVYLWHTRPARPMLVLPHPAALTDLRFSADGARLAVCMANQRALLWRTRKAEAPPTPLCSLGDDVGALAFSPDGQHLATAHTDQQVRLWSAKSGQSEGAVHCDGPVAAVIFSPSNRRLLTVSSAEPTGFTLQLWNCRPKNSIHLLQRDTRKEVSALLINQTGQWLALVANRLLAIWDIEQGKQLSTLYLDVADPPASADSPLLYHWEPKSNIYLPLALNSQPKDESALAFTQSPYLFTISGDAQRAGRCAVTVWNAEHVYTVDALLQQRRLLTTQTQVVGPHYTNVALTIKAVRKTTAKRIARLETEVTNALLHFFHPLTGGPDGKGWPPGRAVYRTEVYQVIEGIAGIDHVAALRFDPPDQENCVVIPPYQGVNAMIQVEISD